MSGKLQIFKPINNDESIVREEWHTYHPFTKSFNNSDEIEIVINQQDVFYDMSEAELYITGKFEEETAENKVGTCTLTNNAGAFLFESMTYELNGKEIEKVRDPGIVSTVKSMLCLTENESRGLDMAGWIWPFTTQKTIDETTKEFSFRLPLSFLFGVFADYKNVLMGRQKLKLVRARHDDNCYTSTGTKKATITLSSVELKVKHVYPSDAVKLRLLDDIAKNKPIFIPFRNWELHELPALRKTSRDIWTVKTMTERARYVIAFFMTGRKDNFKKDCTYFDNLNITDVRLYLNAEVYPYENMNLNFENRIYTEAYRMYTEFQKNYYGKQTSEPLLNFEHFASRCLFVVDCSKQNEALKSNAIDVKLEFQSSKNFPDDSRAFCIIVHDRVLEYQALSGQVRDLL